MIIFFDLDDTLIDTSERHYKVYRDILKFFRVKKILTKEDFWNKKREGKKTIELLPQGYNADFLQRFDDEWRRRIEKKEYLKFDILFPGTHDVLAKLQGEFKLILTTLRNDMRNLFWELQQIEIDKYFHDVLCAPSVSLQSKAELIKNFLMTSDDSKFAIVGDTESDIIAGKEAEMLTFAAIYGIRSKKFLEKFNPDFYLENLYEIINILRKIEI